MRRPFPGGASKTSALVIQLLQIRWRVTLVSFMQAYDGNLSSNDTNAKEQASENAAALRITLKREPVTPPGDGFFLSPAPRNICFISALKYCRRCSNSAAA